METDTLETDTLETDILETDTGETDTGETDTSENSVDIIELNHDCEVCGTPLNSPEAKRTCFGKHAEPCPGYHQMMFPVGNSGDCESCRNWDEYHRERHQEIAVLMDQIHYLDRMAEEKAITLEESMAKTTMRQMATKPEIVLPTSIEFVDNAIHGTSRPELSFHPNDTHTLEQEAQEAGPKQENHRVENEPKEGKTSFPAREGVDYKEINMVELPTIRGILANLNIPINEDSSKQRKELLTKLAWSIYADLEMLSYETRHTIKRSASFWRFAGKRIYNSIVESSKAINWDSDDELSEETIDEQDTNLTENDDIGTFFAVTSQQRSFIATIQQSETLKQEHNNAKKVMLKRHHLRYFKIQLYCVAYLNSQINKKDFSEELKEMLMKLAEVIITAGIDVYRTEAVKAPILAQENHDIKNEPKEGKTSSLVRERADFSDVNMGDLQVYNKISIYLMRYVMNESFKQKNMELVWWNSKLSTAIFNAGKQYRGRAAGTIAGDHLICLNIKLYLVAYINIQINKFSRKELKERLMRLAEAILTINEQNINLTEFNNRLILELEAQKAAPEQESYYMKNERKEGATSSLERERADYSGINMDAEFLRDSQIYFDILCYLTVYVSSRGQEKGCSIELSERLAKLLAVIYTTCKQDIDSALHTLKQIAQEATPKQGIDSVLHMLKQMAQRATPKQVNHYIKNEPKECKTSSPVSERANSSDVNMDEFRGGFLAFLNKQDCSEELKERITNLSGAILTIDKQDIDIMTHALEQEVEEATFKQVNNYIKNELREGKTSSPVSERADFSGVDMDEFIVSFLVFLRGQDCSEELKTRITHLLAAISIINGKGPNSITYPLEQEVEEATLKQVNYYIKNELKEGKTSSPVSERADVSGGSLAGAMDYYLASAKGLGGLLEKLRTILTDDEQDTDSTDTDSTE